MGTHKQAMDKLRAKGRSQIDEAMLFSMVSQMREITKYADELEFRQAIEKQLNKVEGGRFGFG